MKGLFFVFAFFCFSSVGFAQSDARLADRAARSEQMNAVQTVERADADLQVALERYHEAVRTQDEASQTAIKNSMVEKLEVAAIARAKTDTPTAAARSVNAATKVRKTTASDEVIRMVEDYLNQEKE